MRQRPLCYNSSMRPKRLWHVPARPKTKRLAAAAPPRQLLGRHHPLKLYLPIFLVAVGGSIGGLWWLDKTRHASTVAIPRPIAEKVLFDLYVPAQLPKGYTVKDDSYIVKDRALIFYAAKEDGSRIIFSEQPRPKSFDFVGFYQQQLKNAKSIRGSQYASVTGKLENGYTLLSTLTDTTWLLITTQAAISEQDLGSITAHLQQQR